MLWNRWPDTHRNQWPNGVEYALTSIIVVDMKNKKAIDTGYKGSFPVVIDDYIAFISDPEFVNCSNSPFKKIKNYAIYAYDIKSKICKRIYESKGGLEFIID
jgi:hypothetical protein